MTRAVYVYRLVVTLPEGSDQPDWQPEDWEDICMARGWWSPDEGQHDVPPFGWPRRRLYMSESAADGRAKLLRDYGATVAVERSQPVTWGTNA